MEKSTLRKILEKAHFQSHNHDEYWRIVEDLWTKQEDDEIDMDEFMEVLLEFAVPARQSISNGFQKYFSSYCIATLAQQKILSENNDFYFLLPTVYLLHHTMELFFKMVKIDVYNMLGLGGKDIDATALLLPVNVKELNVSNHQISFYAQEEDVLRWFSLLENGKEEITSVCDLYSKLCSLMKMKSLAEEARFPIRKDSYVYVDRSNMGKEEIAECAKIVLAIVRALMKFYVSFHMLDLKDLKSFFDQTVERIKYDDEEF